MTVTKLTLGIDPSVIEAATRYAAEHGTSVSQLVEAFLASVTRGAVPAAATPVLARLRGVLKGAVVADHHDHLVRKYLCDESSST